MYFWYDWPSLFGALHPEGSGTSLTWKKRKRVMERDGFSPIDLLVAVAALGILAAVLAPTLLESWRDGAEYCYASD
jgi:hypothetical protein